nr:T9SS type A sorting domain-containing protein [Saprospiraceae bacterium]
GWNPTGDLDTRISTLINAAYRGIQDARSAVRFFRKDAVDLGNNFGIDADNIAYFGQGTGGYISFGAATLDQYSDILIPKFFGPDITGDGNPDPYVLQPIHGDPFGTSVGIHPQTGDTLSRPNHVTYADGSSINSDVQLSVNLGGALADTSWVSPNNPPMVSFHVPTDPFAPYMEGVLIVPTTGDLIVEVQGSYLVQYKANELGLNDVFKDAGIDDHYTVGANANNDGLEGLYPFLQPVLTNPFNQQPAPQTAPWEWWSIPYWSQFPHPSCPDGVPVSQCNFHVINSIFNQDMSAEKGRTYIDTIIGYLAPRAFLAFGLELDTEVRELDQSEVNFSFYPNPVSSLLNFKSDADKPMLKIEVYDANGRLVKNYNSINHHVFQFDVNFFATGMHFIKVHFDQGVLVKRVVFQ